MSYPPTDEQAAVIDAAVNSSASIMVESFAGTGKSSTAQMLTHAMPSPPFGGALGLAFNVKNKKVMEELFPSWVNVKTMNGLGHSAWMRACGKPLKVDDRKLGRLISTVLKDGKRSEEDWSIIRELVSDAMLAGLVPAEFNRPNGKRGLIEDILENWNNIAEDMFGLVEEYQIDLAKQVLSMSIREAFNGIINFDDQIYMPLFFEGRWEQYGLVIVDEAQDLNSLNHLQVKRSLRPDGRLIVIGDTRQAINQFRGAHSRSMAQLERLRDNWIHLKLSLTFRCPKLIVERVKDHAIGFRAHEGNREGRIVDFNNLTEGEPSWNWEDVKEIAGDGSIAVICRNNAPLLSIAFRLLKNGVGVQMLGRDIGKNLIVLSKKILKKDEIPLPKCVELIQNWMNEEISLAQANKKEHLTGPIMDRGECLLAILESSPPINNAGDLRKRLTDLFAREHGVTLSSGHRSKGLEWDTVIFLDPFRIPSKWAIRANEEGNPSQLEQELNLRYVITTRTKHHLILANLEDME